jgi:SHS2 domain-containing protein
VPAIEWLDHAADVAFRVEGDTLESVFESAARGLFAAMLSVENVRPIAAHCAELSASSLEELLVEWLSDLLVQKELSGRVFSRFDVVLEDVESERPRLVGTAWGERLDPRRHAARSEVKGISYLGLAVERRGERWIAQVVVDV